MNKRLVVFSLDAMVREDVEYLKTLPRFKFYFQNKYSEVKTVRSIYPTTTYPVHTSIVTGCYPDKTGVTNNYPFSTQTEEHPWCWFHDVVKCPDIFDIAHNAGLKTAACFWPVTGRHPSIDYLINEYWTQPGETLLEGFKKNGSNKEMLTIIDKNKNLLPASFIYGGRKNFVQQPFLDNFIVECACDIIEQYKPNVLFLHGGYIDHIRHQTGLFNSAVTEGVKLCDDWIGQIMNSLSKADILDETNIVLLSDHGQLGIVRTVNINTLFLNRGWITTDAEGKIKDWKVFSFSNAMSTLIYVKNKQDELEIEKILCEMAEEGIYGFTEVFNRQKAKDKYHLAGDFSFVLESDGYSSFGNKAEYPIIQKLNNEDFLRGKATHGYLPDKGPQPFFLCMGPNFKQGVVLERRLIVDEAPTFAKILDCKFPYTDGVCMDEILNI